jgi:hypothetical protein
LSAIEWIAGQDGLRDASSKQPRDLLTADGSHGLSRIVARSIAPSALAAPGRLTSEPASRPIC